MAAATTAPKTTTSTTKPEVAVLFEPLRLGRFTLKNRVLMAPLTRCRATHKTHVPTEMMAEYYAQRASAGLIIAEATMVSAGQSAFLGEPGIYSEEQVAAWRRVTDAVHARGGLIFLQIWHGGRAVVVENDGVAAVAPSAIAITGHKAPAEFSATGEKTAYPVPEALTAEGIAGVVADFARGARNAIAAGFDGVEIHGANGYLIDEFWRASANKREDAYGGPAENRARFMLEVVDAVVAEIGADRVGIRLSPLNSFNDMRDDAPVELLRYTVAELAKRELAFLHVMRADFFQAQTGDVLTPVRELYKGALVTNMGYEPGEAAAAVAAGQVDAVAFGTKFLANPDLPERIAAGAALTAPDAATFYTPGAAGYTDYPALAAATA